VIRTCTGSEARNTYFRYILRAKLSVSWPDFTRATRESKSLNSLIISARQREMKSKVLLPAKSRNIVRFTCGWQIRIFESFAIYCSCISGVRPPSYRSQKAERSRYSPKISRRASEISPSVAPAFTASTITGIRLEVPFAAERRSTNALSTSA
jgi:hypothetical protein